MLHFDSSHFIVTGGSRVSRAPPRHTFPAFLNFYGIKPSQRNARKLQLIGLIKIGSFIQILCF